jgi:hypothetical protein
MTEAESAQDSIESYAFALAALRLRLIVRGDIFPRPDEPIDLMTLRALDGERL